LDFSEALEKFGIKETQVKSGDHKPSAPIFGSVSEEELQQMQARSDRTHKVFKEYVLASRGEEINDLDFVTTGDFWLGTDALELGLVDKITISSEYLEEKARSGNVVLKLESHKNKDKKGLFGDTGVFQNLLDWLLPEMDDDASSLSVGHENSVYKVVRSTKSFLPLPV